jgi:hypothetical protein
MATKKITGVTHKFKKNKQGDIIVEHPKGQGGRINVTKQSGAKTAGKPKPGESEAMKKKRASFKARHAKNISKGKMSAAWWANQSKW